MRAKSGWLVVGLIAIAGAMTFFAQRQRAAELRLERDQQRAAGRALDGIRAEHERLLAAQTSVELSRSADERDALRQARTEVENLRHQVETVEATVEQRARPAERFTRGQTVPASEWKNAGGETPAAAFETALWAGAGGDVDAFAKMITLIDPNAQKAARALLDSLPETMRAEYGTPERLIALLSIKDVPLGSVTVRQSNVLQDWPMGEAHQMQVVLTQADGTQKSASLILLNRGEGWKLVVMEGAVAKYAAQLKNAESLANGK